MPNAGPTPDDRRTVAEGLAKLLADSYAIYLKTHGYHWNVRGPNFSQLHALFMAQYTEVWTAIDEVAERIRALGELAPQGYGAFANLSSIKDGDPTKSAQAMLEDLVDGHQTVIGTLYALLPLAQRAGDEVTASLISDRLTAHEKHAWMLRASL
ncbi:Dps family protein [Phenylobacterium sp.]|jgi:starvation-inducible DNA-binding protein|uniref:Dps family protein n=1 Tax=Phenylobacterium sp. TaxID=1871053 RepID=UPI0035AEDBBA